MKKVIEHGYKKYKTQCFTCGCIFEYEPSDIEDDKKTVTCPDCGHTVSHYPSDYVRNTEYEDSEDNEDNTNSENSEEE